MRRMMTQLLLGGALATASHSLLADEIQRIAPGGNADRPFSEAVIYDDVIYLSGQLGIDPETGKLAEGGVGPETRQTLENIAATLERLDTSMDHVIKCTVFLADIAEWGDMNKEYVTFFDGKPARSAMGTGNGIALGARVEIECMAAAPDDDDDDDEDDEHHADGAHDDDHHDDDHHDDEHHADDHHDDEHHADGAHDDEHHDDGAHDDDHHDDEHHADPAHAEHHDDAHHASGADGTDGDAEASMSSGPAAAPAESDADTPMTPDAGEGIGDIPDAESEAAPETAGDDAGESGDEHSADHGAEHGGKKHGDADPAQQR